MYLPFQKNLKYLSSSNAPPSSQQPPPQLGHSPFATQSPSQSLQKNTQLQAQLCTWIAHPSQSPSPFPRCGHALSGTTTAAGELFLFGGYSHGSPTNDLYVFSTSDFSSTLWHTSGNVPSPRVGHSAVLAGTCLLIWGGMTNFRDQKTPTLNQRHDDSIHLLDLGTLNL